MKLLFSIEGNIGSGKSTLIEVLKNSKKFNENENLIYLPEPVDVWNEVKDSLGVTILERYYQDQKKYAFPFQMMTYISRLSLIKKTINSSPDNCIILMERSIYTDREIFAKMLHDDGKIEDIEYSIYLKWFDEFSESYLHGIIYVKTTPEKCLSQIEYRNRKGEESIPLDYLENCHKYHEEWINNTNIKRFYLNNIDSFNLSDTLLLNLKDFINRT